MNQHFLSADEFKKTYSEVPKLCVDLIIVVQGGVLLTLRSLPEWKGHWHLPGATVRYKEPIEEVAARIAQEELNMSVKVVRSLGYIEYPGEEKERGFGWSVSIPLLCVPTSVGFEVGKDASEAKVFTEVPDCMIPEQKIFLSARWTEITSGR